MKTYSQMKKGENGMPQWDELYSVIMFFAEGRHTWIKTDLYQQVADAIHMPDELRYANYTQGDKAGTNVIEDITSYAVSTLRGFRLIGPMDNWADSDTCYITDHGKKMFEKYGSKLNQETVMML